MVFVEIRHGVGNQMMQYAFARKIAEERGEDVYVVKRWYREEDWKRNEETKRKYQLGKFEISAKKATKSQEKKFWINRDSIVSKAKTYVSKKLQINPGGNVFFGRCMYKNPEKNIDKISECEGDVYLVGMWKHVNYFGDILDKIRKEFRVKNIKTKNENLIEKMNQYNSVSIHTRRGDYLNTEHRVLSETKYYKNAVNLIYRKEDNIKAYIFSDDIRWCKKNFNLSIPVKYVDENRGEDSYKDIALMKNCKHNIVANSTFSLWGALLNDSKKKMVIGPEGWTQRMGRQYIDKITSVGLD